MKKKLRKSVPLDSSPAPVSGEDDMRTDFRMRPTKPIPLRSPRRSNPRARRGSLRHPTILEMQAPQIFEPSPNFKDPRRQAGFEPSCWPKCNGKAAPPPDSVGLHERRCLEFLAAFYRLNVLNEQLQEFRKARAPQRRIKTLLKKIAAATSTLEALEDRYAPIGFFGEPVMKGMRYHNIIFRRPELPRLQPKASTLSSHFAIPGLDQIPASELRGPVKIFRFGHGKVDI